jgi:hypothetical protein
MTKILQYFSEVVHREDIFVISTYLSRYQNPSTLMIYCIICRARMYISQFSSAPASW